MSTGHVHFDGHDITGLAEHQRVRLGIAQTFQHSSLFAALSCGDNVLLALQRRTGEARRLFGRRSRRARRRGRRAARRASGSRAPAGAAPPRCRTASGASSRWRSRSPRGPRLLLLDEPAAGMSPAETERLATIIEELDPELAVLIVEHDLDFVFRVAREVSVLHLGSLLMTGPAAEVRASDEVARVYSAAPRSTTSS